MCVCVFLKGLHLPNWILLFIHLASYLVPVTKQDRLGIPLRDICDTQKPLSRVWRVLRSRPSDSSKSKQNWTHVILENLLAQMIWYILTLNSPIQSCLLSLLETRKSQHKPTKPNQTPSKPTHINDKKNKVLSFQYCLKGIISSQGSTNSNTIHILRLSIFIALLGTLVGSISSQR